MYHPIAIATTFRPRGAEGAEELRGARELEEVQELSGSEF